MLHLHHQQRDENTLVDMMKNNLNEENIKEWEVEAISRQANYICWNCKERDMFLCGLDNARKNRRLVPQGG